MYHITTEGKQWLHDHLFQIKKEEYIQFHKENHIFTQEIYGLTIEQYICPITRHGVMLVEGFVFDSSPILEHEGQTPEEMAQFGFEQFKSIGIKTLLMVYPKLYKFLEKERE